MSFILDALKKSETERQRGDAPALHEMKMAPARQGVATWLIVLAALLAINIVVLTVVLLRGNHGAPVAADAGTESAPAAAAVTSPVPAPVPPAAPAATVAAPPASPAAGPADSGAADATPAGRVGGAGRPSDDDAPAVEPPRGAPASTGAPGNVSGGVEATGGNSGELPTYQQVASAPGSTLPELSLNLHSYSSNPADRFIFLNMTRLREGQTSPQGIRVEAITPDGAILSWQGSKFLLQRQ